MRRLKAVAVRAEDSQVLDPVVVAITVDVIELYWDSPVGGALGPTAQLAAGLLQSCSEQSEFQLVRTSRPTEDKYRFERRRNVWSKYEASVPRFADEVTRIEPEFCDSPLNVVVVSTSRSQPESSKNLGDASRVDDRAAQGIRRPAPWLSPTLEVRSVELELSGSLFDRTPPSMRAAIRKQFDPATAARS